ncbi:MAG: SLBB domain-containing protein [Candidatus Binatia bacterium]
MRSLARLRSGLLLAALIALTLVHGGAAAQSTPPATPGDLTTTRDRERLEVIVTGRLSESTDDGYVIGADDLLDIRVPDLLDAGHAAYATGTVAPIAQAPVFQQGLRVSASGLVSLPLIGPVRAEGLTPSRLETEIARRLREAGVLVNPQVSVTVAEYRSRVVAVVGSVERPGLYPLTRPGATLADLIWAAGGPTREAGRLVEFTPATQAAPENRVATIAQPSQSDVVQAPAARDDAPAPWLALRGARSEAAGAGRRLTIDLTRAPDGLRSFALDGPPRVVIDLDGPLGRGGAGPGRVPLGDPLAPGIRAAAHDGHLRLVIDLASAVPHAVHPDGSRLIVDLGAAEPAAAEPVATPPAVRSTARPEAPSHGTPVRIDLERLLHASALDAHGVNPQVRPGDVISIAPAGSVLVDGWVGKPGSYPVTRGLTLSGAVAAAGGDLFPADRGKVTLKRVMPTGEQQLYTIDLAQVTDGDAADVPITDGDIIRVPASATKLVPWSLWTAVREIVRFGTNAVVF